MSDINRWQIKPELAGFPIHDDWHQGFHDFDICESPKYPENNLYVMGWQANTTRNAKHENFSLQKYQRQEIPKNIVIEIPENVAFELFAVLEDLDRDVLLVNQLFTLKEILEKKLNPVPSNNDDTF